MSEQRQPNPINGGWAAYRKIVDKELHTMTTHPHVKCLTHKDCHMDAFYPGKLYRSMEMERDENGILKMKKRDE